MQELTPHTVMAFFAWLLNQRRGKGGRKVKGLRSEDSLGTYYKYFRLACERATGRKIFDGKEGPDRLACRVRQLTLLLCHASWLISHYVDAAEAFKGARPLEAETREGSHIRRRPRSDHVDQPDHDEEEVHVRPAPYPARPLSLARRILREPAASRPQPLLPPHHRDLTPGPQRGTAQYPDRVHIRVYKAVSRHEGNVHGCLSLPHPPRYL